MSKRKLSGKALAIQLGWYESHIVLVDKHAQIQYGISVPTPVGAVEDGVIRDEAAVCQMLKEALTTPEFKGVRRVVFTLVTSQVISETATTPDMPANRVEKLIQANVDMYFPVDVQDCHVVWQSIGTKVNDGVKEQEVQLWAVPNAMLGAYYTVANSCGLSVAAIDYCGNSIVSAVGASYSTTTVKEGRKLNLNAEISFGRNKPAQPREDNTADSGEQPVPPTDLHITMEKELLGMTFVQNGRVVMQRFIQCGPNPIYQIGEIAMMVEYFQGLDLGRGSKIRGILSGALAEETALIAELSDVLDIPLATFPVTYDTSWFLCMGAVLTNLDFGIPALNRADKTRRHFQSQLWQYGLVLAGGLAILAVVMLTMTARLGWSSEIRALEGEKQVLMIRSAQSSGFADNYYAYENAYESYSGDWDTIFNSLQTYNDNLVLVMEEMEDLMPEKASVVGMEIGSTGLNVTFAAETKEEAAYLMMALRNMQYASLEYISSLQGGGAGPATTYGSREAAPLEGSSADRKTWNELTVPEQGKLYNPILNDVTKWKLAFYFGMGKAYKDNAQYMDGLYALCALPNGNGTVENLDSYTRDQRVTAFTNMFSTNPFTMQKAESMLMGAVSTDLQSPLAQYLIYECRMDVAGITSHTTVNDLQADVEQLIRYIVYPDPNYDALADTEALLLEDDMLNSWYAYYLEKAASGEDSPCLNTDQIVYEVVDRPEATTVNSILYNNCLSAATRSLIEEVTKVEAPPTEPSTQPTDSSTEPSTNPEEEKDAALMAKLPALMTEYLENGKVTSVTASERMDYTRLLGMPLEACLEEQHTKYKNGTLEEGEMKAAIKAYYASLSSTEPTDPSTQPTDPSTNPSEPSTETDETLPNVDSTTLELALKLCMGQYITEGEVTLPIYQEYEQTIETLLEKYFAEGSTQTIIQGMNVDATLDKCITDGNVDTELSAAIEQYQADATKLSCAAVKTMLDRYYAGDTGNTVLNAKVKELHDASTNPSDPSNPSTNPTEPSEPSETDVLVEQVAKILKTYLETGKTGLSEMESLLIKDKLGVKPEDYLENLLSLYFTRGQTGQAKWDKVIADYLATLSKDEADKLALKYKAPYWLSSYLAYASQGREYPDGEQYGRHLIEEYLRNGFVIGNSDLTQILNDHVESRAVDGYLKVLRSWYPIAMNKFEKYPAVKEMLENYIKKETTGSADLDDRLDAVTNDLYNAGKNQGGGGNSQSQQPQGQPDTRYFFMVSLMYKQELLEAELERKGLDYDTKVEKLEVAE